MAEHSAAVTIVSFIEPFIILQCLNTAVSLQVTFTSHANPIQVEFLEGVVVSNHIWDCPLEGETHTHTQYIWFDQQLNKHTPPHKAVDTLAAWVHKSDLINANSQIGFWKLISGTKKETKTSKSVRRWEKLVDGLGGRAGALWMGQFDYVKDGYIQGENKEIKRGGSFHASHQHLIKLCRPSKRVW